MRWHLEIHTSNMSVHSASEQAETTSTNGVETAMHPGKPPFSIVVNWPVGGGHKKLPDDIQKQTGISSYNLVYTGGWIYSYQLWFFTAKNYNYYFHDDSGDRYRVDVFVPGGPDKGASYVCFNSIKPTIVRITGDFE